MPAWFTKWNQYDNKIISFVSVDTYKQVWQYHYTNGCWHIYQTCVNGKLHYRQTSYISRTKLNIQMFLVSSCSRLCPIHWSQALSREWRCSWSSADRRCSNYIFVIRNVIAYRSASYIRGFTVILWNLSFHFYHMGVSDFYSQHYAIKRLVIWKALISSLVERLSIRDEA